MDLADDAVARLNRLALVNDGNFVVMVRDLVRSAMASAPSCIAVIITLGDEEPLYAMDDSLRHGNATVRASLRAQITASRSAQPGHRVVFLAEKVGEFANFTAGTLKRPGSPDLHHLVIDGDLDAAAGLAQPNGSTDIDATRTVDRAVGVLLDRGYLPADALETLRTRAHAAGRSLTEQALLVLRSLG
jgi:hypothetical protein